MTWFLLVTPSMVSLLILTGASGQRSSRMSCQESWKLQKSWGRSSNELNELNDFDRGCYNSGNCFFCFFDSLTWPF